MSDLKYRTVEQLKSAKADTEKYIETLQQKLGGQQERLKWINHYIREKTPKELTIAQIEQALGHKVIIKF